MSSGSYRSATRRSLQCFLQSVLERRIVVVSKDLARFSGVPRDKSTACFPNAFQSRPSNVYETVVAQQQSFMPLELPAPAGAIRKSSFYFRRILETISTWFELLGFPQSSAFSRGVLLSSASLSGSSCTLRPLQTFKGCC